MIFLELRKILENLLKSFENSSIGLCTTRYDFSRLTYELPPPPNKKLKNNINLSFFENTL